MPEPYYQDEAVTLHLGDMLAVPLSEAADLLLTDPPYSRAGGLHTGRKGRVATATDLQGSDQFWRFWFEAVARRMLGYVRPSGCGFVFCDYRTVALVESAVNSSETGWTLSQCLVWDRLATGMGSPFRASHELIAFLRGPEFQWTGRRDVRNVLPFRWPYGEHEHHPAEKPVALLEHLITITTAPGALVLDPFVGSGSTLLAARVLGRRAVGIELEEQFCATAVDRLGQSTLVGALTDVGGGRVTSRDLHPAKAPGRGAVARGAGAVAAGSPPPTHIRSSVSEGERTDG
jgi:hypothetical protein